MDKILSYLPEMVHLYISWDNDPYYDYSHGDFESREIIVPKIWLKHGERGKYNEWTIKKTYYKQFIDKYGGDLLYKKIEIIEWNQLENVTFMLHKAQKIGFRNILEIAKEVNKLDVKYTHTVGI